MWHILFISLLFTLISIDFNGDKQNNPWFLKTIIFLMFKIWDSSNEEQNWNKTKTITFLYGNFQPGRKLFIKLRTPHIVWLKCNCYTFLFLKLIFTIYFMYIHTSMYILWIFFNHLSLAPAQFCMKYVVLSNL